MLEISHVITILQYGPGSYFCYKIPPYICDKVYSKSLGTCFCARKCMATGTDGIYVDQVRELHMGSLWAPTENYICVVLEYFVQFSSTLIIIF